MDPIYNATVTHHGREFQRLALERQIYFAPVDESERDRLNFQHAIFALVFDDRVVFPSLNNPRRILDCGYGTGAWAEEVADLFPDCQVYGVDISNHLHVTNQPQNLHLQIDDLNRRFAFARNSFDLVHSQLVAGGIDAERWPTYLRDMYRVTRPGGWCQMVEMYYQVQSYNGTLTDDHALRQWSTRLFESLQGLKDLRKPLHLANDMREHGFVDVEERMIMLPTCGWPTESERENEIGRAHRENVRDFLSSLALYPFTEILGMHPQEAQILIARARNEADNHDFEAYFPLYVVVGRKPIA